jgi:methionyl-tRNA synthetase
VIYNLLEGLRVISGLIYPIMPDTATTMQKHLGMDPEKPFYNLDILRTWKTITAGTMLPKSIMLFPRVDMKKDKTSFTQTDDSESLIPEIKPEINLDEFNKIDLRVGTVINAEAIPRAKKLLKIEVDLGEKRTVVAGISETYTPDELVGKQIIILANLKPTKLMGILSRGMLIAAVDNNVCSIATLDKKVKPGTPLS